METIFLSLEKGNIPISTRPLSCLLGSTSFPVAKKPYIYRHVSLLIFATTAAVGSDTDTHHIHEALLATIPTTHRRSHFRIGTGTFAELARSPPIAASKFKQGEADAAAKHGSLATVVRAPGAKGRVAGAC